MKEVGNVRAHSGEFAGKVFQVPGTPNKSPEPTPTAVTPRAIECMVELKQMNLNRFEAHGAPAAVVAHL
jgi:hypothetical protein